MAKAKAAPAPVERVGKIEGDVKYIKLQQIVANSSQSRGMGVMPALKNMGYGVFEKIVPEKECIWNMLWSDKPEVAKEALDLIEAEEKKLWEFAASLAKTGQMQAIGVVETEEEGSYDVIYGMRRTLAMAINYVKDSKAEPDCVEARILQGNMDEVESRVLALKENNDREDESPIEQAMNFNWLQKKKGLTPQQIASRIGRSDQHVRNLVKLLDKKLLDKQMDIHTRKLSVDAALKLLEKRRTNPDSNGDDKNGEKERTGPPKAKLLQKYYEAAEKPEALSDKEWDLMQVPDVRELLAIWLDRKFTTFEEVQEAAEAAKKLKLEEDAKATKKALVIKKERAYQLLIALGKTNARTWGDDVLKEKLENPAGISDSKDQVLENASLTKLLEKVWEAYENGIEISIVEGEKKAK